MTASIYCKKAYGKMAKATMTTPSKTCKAAGLKSLTECAELNGVSRMTAYRVFYDDRPRFNEFVRYAVAVKAELMKAKVAKVLG